MQNKADSQLVIDSTDTDIIMNLFKTRHYKSKDTQENFRKTVLRLAEEKKPFEEIAQKIIEYGDVNEHQFLDHTIYDK